MKSNSQRTTKKKYVVKKNYDFQTIIQAKKKVINSNFIIYYLPNHLTYCRFGITSGKKFGKAVLRNKIKRQIRMMLPKNPYVKKVNYDFVIMIRNNYLENEFSDNHKSLHQLINKV